MHTPAFEITRLPEMVFGDHCLQKLPSHVRRFGKRLLLVTGQRSFCQTPQWQSLQDALQAAHIHFDHLRIPNEPTPAMVDDAVTAFKDADIEVVAGIGGGSALDAAKAIAGLLPSGDSVMCYLEGVGTGKPFAGPTLPFIAAPTTAGTGSEATKNAVITQPGPGGFKKSFRHPDLVARIALLDPTLLASCPPDLIAADGMDAFTQLLEAYTSQKANPITDALAWSGLERFCTGFWPAWRGDDHAAKGREHLAYGSLMSGVCLAQVGLGVVHGLASPLGASYPIPHGVVCGTLLGAATEINIAALQQSAPDHPALLKYARVGRLISQRPEAGHHEALQFLVATLHEWINELALPRLSHYAIAESELDGIIEQTGMKNNPVALSPHQVKTLLTQRL